MKTTWNVIALQALLIFSVSGARAEFVGLNIGANHWTPDLIGSFGSVGQSQIDLTTDLGLDEPTPSNLVLILEHPIPLLPNVKYQSFDLDSSGSNSHSGLTFNGTNFDPGIVNSTFDLSHDDIVLYYELLDNWVSLDLGLDFKVFDGQVELTDDASPTTTESVLVDETVPLFYISARFDLPFSGFYIGADINNNFNTGDGNAEDSSIMLGYESGSGLGIEGGIKKFSLELNDINNLNADLEYDGIYLNGYFRF
jgi:outer membrane protein